MSTAAKPLLQVEHLKVDFRTEDGVVHAVDDVSFDLRPGEVLAVVGESGSGKSVTAMTLMGLTRSPNAKFGGEAYFNGLNLIDADDGEDLAGAELERDVVDRVDDAVLGAEVDLQVLHVEQGCGGAHERRIRGSRTA